jgi:hypothetical protein
MDDPLKYAHFYMCPKKTQNYWNSQELLEFEYLVSTLPNPQVHNNLT